MAAAMHTCCLVTAHMNHSDQITIIRQPTLAPTLSSMLAPRVVQQRSIHSEDYRDLLLAADFVSIETSFIVNKNQPAKWFILKDQKAWPELQQYRSLASLQVLIQPLTLATT